MSIARLARWSCIPLHVAVVSATAVAAIPVRGQGAGPARPDSMAIEKVTLADGIYLFRHCENIRPG